MTSDKTQMKLTLIFYSYGEVANCRVCCGIFTNNFSGNLSRDVTENEYRENRLISKCQTPLRGHRLRTCCTTPPTDKLTTILQLVVQQICHIAMPEPSISTCQDAGMWQIFVRWWWIYCTTSCRIVVSSSVGVLYNMSVAGVRVVEFGTNAVLTTTPWFTFSTNLYSLKSYTCHHEESCYSYHTASRTSSCQGDNCFDRCHNNISALRYVNNRCPLIYENTRRRQNSISSNI